MEKIGLIGYGKLGKRMAQRWKESGISALIFDPAVPQDYRESFEFADSIGELIENCSIIFLVIPPSKTKEILKSCVMIDENRQYISVAAGIPLEDLYQISTNRNYTFLFLWYQMMTYMYAFYIWTCLFNFSNLYWIVIEVYVNFIAEPL